MSLVKKNNEDRVMVFIDLRNITNSAKKECTGPFLVDFAAMTNKLVGDRKITGAYIFDGKGAQHNENDTVKFHQCLEYSGFRVKVRDSYDSEEREQKEVDVAMACEILIHAMHDDYDAAIIVTGDRDFVPAIEHIQQMGKTAEVASFRESTSGVLIRKCDTYCDLTKMPILTMFPPAEEDSEKKIPESNETETIIDTAEAL